MSPNTYTYMVHSGLKNKIFKSYLENLSCFHASAAWGFRHIEKGDFGIDLMTSLEFMQLFGTISKTKKKNYSLRAIKCLISYRHSLGILLRT